MALGESARLYPSVRIGGANGAALSIVTVASKTSQAQETVPQRFGLWAHIREDWRHNGRDWTRPGFRALAVHRFGVWRMRVRPRILRMPLSLLYRTLYRYVRNHYSIELHYTVKVGRRVVIGHQGAIVVHDQAEIGDDCLIRQGVTLGASSHQRAWEAPRLGRGVQLGAGAMVLGDVTVGDGAFIGANAVVTTDVPAGAKVVAAPSIIIPASEVHATEQAHRYRGGDAVLTAFLLAIHQCLAGMMAFADQIADAALV